MIWFQIIDLTNVYIILAIDKDKNIENIKVKIKLPTLIFWKKLIGKLFLSNDIKYTTKKLIKKIPK